MQSVSRGLPRLFKCGKILNKWNFASGKKLNYQAMPLNYGVSKLLMKKRGQQEVQAKPQTVEDKGEKFNFCFFM